jgi:hypothetical protein
LRTEISSLGENNALPPASRTCGDLAQAPAGSYTLFQEDWWLEALAPGAWKAAEVRNGNELLGRLPYIIKKKMGFVAVGQPLLTQTLGPWIAPLSGKEPVRLAREKDILTALIDQLPAFDLFSQCFHHSITNWLPFYWRGFQQTTRYTYVLRNLASLDDIWSGMNSNVHRNIRKAEKILEVRCEPDIDLLYDMNVLTFQRQGLPVPYSRDFLKRLDSACEARNARRMFFALDHQRRCHHALYLIWDSRSAYYLIGGGDPELRSSGAASLLMWEAIQFASKVSRCFDFEGSMLEPVERFVRNFGAEQVPYFYISRKSRRFSALSAARECLNALLRRP